MVQKHMFCRSADARAELLFQVIQNNYEDLLIITSRNDHKCTLDRWIGIYW